MTIFVTGGSGLLGNNVIRTLLARGDRVRVLARTHESVEQTMGGLDVDVCIGDLEAPDVLDNAIKDTRGVVHAAGFVHIGWTHSDVHERVNYQGSRLVAGACQRHTVPLVHVSSVNALGIGAWDEPATETTARDGITPCPYVLSKRAADDAIREMALAGLQATIVYPGFLLGPWDWKPSSGKMLIEVARRFTPLAPVGGFSICDVRHVADAIVSALNALETGDPRDTRDAVDGKDPVREYILAGENLTYLDAWRLFAKVSGGNGPIYWSGPLQRIIAGRFGDLWGKLFGREPDVNSAAVKMSNLPHYFSSDRAVSELGYQVGTALEAAQAAWDWFVEHRYV